MFSEEKRRALEVNIERLINIRSKRRIELRWN